MAIGMETPTRISARSHVIVTLVIGVVVVDPTVAVVSFSLFKYDLFLLVVRLNLNFLWETI